MKISNIIFSVANVLTYIFLIFAPLYSNILLIRMLFENKTYSHKNIEFMRFIITLELILYFCALIYLIYYNVFKNPYILFIYIIYLIVSVINAGFVLNNLHNTEYYKEFIKFILVVKLIFLLLIILLDLFNYKKTYYKLIIN